MTEEMKNDQSNQFSPDRQKNINSQETTNNRKYVFIAVVIAILLISLVVVATIFLIKPENSAITEQIRDIFIIFMALMSLILGIALVILITQLSILINLLQNEIRPIINATNETVNTLKGTTQFISNNLTEPIIKLNQYLAMIKHLIKPSKK